jgi:hypothetical protein
MMNRLFYNPVRQARVTSRESAWFLLVAAFLLATALPGLASSDAPQWMHALVGVPLPTYDEKTDAVLLYSDTNVTVLSADKIRTHVREAYKILRPSGRTRGIAVVYFNSPGQKVTSLHGWCIPAQGKDYEVKDKDSLEQSLPGYELIADVKRRFIDIPAPDAGNIVGYEYEVEEQPLVLQDSWYFQKADPVRESHYSLQLPPGWEFKAAWLNYSEVKASQIGSNQWQWSVGDVKGIRSEPEMPPVQGVSGQMVISYFAPGGPSAKNGFADWRGMGNWYLNLVSDRMQASTPIKEQVIALTASKAGVTQKMQALAEFVQHDIRYVAIELGIGGWQPHPATDVFAHRYGDCKDKATLLRSMLREIGIESYHVVIYTERGAITPATPAHHGFNHAITAIKLPDGLADASLIAIVQHPKLGKLLFFDPTDEMTPFGHIPGHLQANYGLLVTPDGGELIQLPQQPSNMNSIRRTAKLTLDPTGTLKGEIKEVRLGDRASSERWRLRTVTKDIDRIKPIESLLADSLSSFRITHATVVNLQHTDQPFGFDYSFESDSYAKNAGNLLLLRPRVVGSKSSGILETKEPRKFPVEFEGPVQDTDSFEITIPPGYEVDDLPPPVDSDYSFASYHSRTEAKGSVIHYTRTFEVKELSVPLEKMEDLKKFYRIVASDERNTAVLKPTGPGK